MTTITVIKLNYLGQESWRYAGKLIEKRPHKVIIEAFFDRDDIQLNEMILSRGDRFIETYYNDRWYNIYEIHAKQDDNLKGWYCNISWPAEFDDQTITFRDLALDLLVFPDGRQITLDQEEFFALPLSEETQDQVHLALDKLKSGFKQKMKRKSSG